MVIRKNLDDDDTGNNNVIGNGEMIRETLKHYLSTL